MLIIKIRAKSDSISDDPQCSQPSELHGLRLLQTFAVIFASSAANGGPEYIRDLDQSSEERRRRHRDRIRAHCRPDFGGRDRRLPGGGHWPDGDLQQRFHQALSVGDIAQRIALGGTLVPPSVAIFAGRSASSVAHPHCAAAPAGTGPALCTPASTRDRRCASRQISVQQSSERSCAFSPGANLSIKALSSPSPCHATDPGGCSASATSTHNKVFGPKRRKAASSRLASASDSGSIP